MAETRCAAWRLQPHSIGFTLLLGGLGTLPPFAIDMALPALTQIGIALQSAMGNVLLTLSFFMAGFSLAQLAFGPVSDRFGRWPTLVVGCSLFSVASIACALAPTIEFLLVARFVEGCGAGAGMVMVFAMVRDLFEGPQARTKLSYVTVVLNVAPMIAPAVGAALLSIGDWRLIYWALGVAGASLGFVQMTVGSLTSALVAWLGDGQTALSMTGTMAVCAGLALAIYIFWLVPVQREKTKK